MIEHANVTKDTIIILFTLVHLVTDQNSNKRKLFIARFFSKVLAFNRIYLLLSTFVTNNFELMGLRQAYLYFRNQPYKLLPFTRKFMYRYSRHPMMLGVMIGLWAIPMMTVTHFIMATQFTIYVAVGIYFEEKDLIKDFGEVYQQYKKEIATFLPGMF